MGKGRILSAAGDGLYTIEIIEDRARAESARASAVTRISDLADRIATLEQDVVALQSAVDQAVAAQDTAINLYQQEMAAEGASEVDLAAPAQAVIQAAAERDKVRGQIAQMQLEKLGLEATIARIDALPPLRQMQAWCADYTDDLSGDIATAEVPGEIGQVLIQPGYDGSEVSAWPAGAQGGAVWSAEKDGAIQPSLSGTPAGVFYHLAMMPGWQKWRPTFRLAIITAISNDVCDITLDAANSRFQNLNINLSPVYSGVPIYYMECNGEAFQVGDRVLVAFSGNTGTPMVVGFESQPKLCRFISLIHLHLHVDVFSLLAGGSVPDSYCSTGALSLNLTPWSVARYELATDSSIFSDQMMLYRYTEIEDGFDVGSLEAMAGFGKAGAVFSVVRTVSDDSQSTDTVELCVIDGENETWTTLAVPVLNQYVISDVGHPISEVDAFYKSNYQPSADINPFSFEYSVQDDQVTITAKHATSPASIIGDGSWYAVALDGAPSSEVVGGSQTLTLEDLPTVSRNGVTLHPRRFLAATEPEDVEWTNYSHFRDDIFVERRVTIAIEYGNAP